MAKITRFWHRYKWELLLHRAEHDPLLPVHRLSGAAGGGAGLPEGEPALDRVDRAEELSTSSAAGSFLDSMRHTSSYVLFVVAAWIISSLAVAASAALSPTARSRSSAVAFYLPYVTSIIVISLV